MYQSCPLCDHSETYFAFSAKDYEHRVPGEWSVAECKACGFLFQDPIPSEKQIPSFYPPSYSAYGSKSPIRLLFEFVYFVDGLRAKALVKGSGRVLDIGCGDGSALEKLRGDGDWTLHGVEFDPVAAQRARDRGLDVVTGSLESASFPDNYFDLVRMGHVIEHVRDPAAVAREVFRILKPGGHFVGETPNVDCLDFRIFRKYWGALHIPRHLTFFSRQNLADLLKRTGFTQISLQPRLRTVGWSCGIQNYLADRYSLTVPPSGRVSWYLLLILLFLPFTAIQSLWGATASIAFVSRKSIEGNSL